MGMSRPFLIFGMPRSMTAWLSCYLTVGEVFCQHEMTRTFDSAKEIAHSIRTQPFPVSGMADPAALMIWRELTELLPDGNLIYIRRSPSESQEHLAAVCGFDPVFLSDRYVALRDAASSFCEHAEPHIMDFASLTDEHWLRILWGWVAGDRPLPQQHLQKMMSLHIRQRDEIIREAARQPQTEGAHRW